MAKALKNITFEEQSNFVFNDSLIEVVGGVLKLASPYSALNPTVETLKSIPLTLINSFVPVVSTPSLTAIKYILIKDGQDYYYSSGWVVSDGSYTQSNTLAEIQANLATFTTERARVKIKVFLHADGTTATPSITSIAFGFNYTGYSTPDDVRAIIGNTANNFDDEDIISNIEIADSQIDGYLNGYTLPLTTTPAEIRRFSAIIAAYNLYSALEVQEGTQKSPQRIRYEQAIEELKEIKAGKRGVTGLTKGDTLYCYSTSDAIAEKNEITLMVDNWNE